MPACADLTGGGWPPLSSAPSSLTAPAKAWRPCPLSSAPTAAFASTCHRWNDSYGPRTRRARAARTPCSFWATTISGVPRASPRTTRAPATTGAAPRATRAPPTASATRTPTASASTRTTPGPRRTTKSRPPRACPRRRATSACSTPRAAASRRTPRPRRPAPRFERFDREHDETSSSTRSVGGDVGEEGRGPRRAAEPVLHRHHAGARRRHQTGLRQSRRPAAVISLRDFDRETESSR